MSASHSEVVMEGQYSIWPRHCTVTGGVQLTVCAPTPLPNSCSLHLLFPTDTNDTTDITADTAGTSGVKMVHLVRDEAQLHMYHTTAPAHATPGHVQLSLRCTDSSSGQRTTLHTAQFTYTLHDHRSLAERLLRLQQQQNTNEGLPLQLDLIPLSESPTELAELDRSLTAAVAEWELPLHWSLVQDSSGSGEDRAPHTTLFHLASHHNLPSLANHLMMLPGADLALCLPNEEGLTPVDIARDLGNMEMVKVLTCTSVQPLVGDDRTVNGGLGSGFSSKRNSQDELQRFREINEEWRDQIKRHKVSSGSMESTSFSRPSTEMLAANPRDRLPTPPFPGISSLPPSRFARRKSIAVMEPGQRHITAVGCLQINVKVPELAAMERQRKQSWSMVVGGTDSRSVGTGLNELDRVIAEDEVQQRMSAMQGDLAASQGGQAASGNHLDPARLNLLYCYSVSCPLLTEDNESAANSTVTSARTSPGPGSDIAESPPLHLRVIPALPTSISVPEDLSETGLHTQHLERYQKPSTRPLLSASAYPLPTLSVKVPQVITTRYSTEDLEIVSQLHGRVSSYDECSAEERDGVSVTERGSQQSLKSDSHSTVNQQEEDGEEEEEEDELCQSVSAPHLGGGSEENEADEREETLEEDQRQEDRKATEVTKQIANGGDRSTVDGRSSNEGSTSDRCSSSYVHSESGAVNRLRKKTHRRSQSMSIVELGSPLPEQKLLPEEEGKDGEGVSLQNRASVTLKPGRPGNLIAESNQSLDQHSNASASRSNSIKGGDNRSRASSFFTDVSSMHESGESSEDDTMPELSGMSCASLEGADPHEEPSTATPIVNETEQHHLKLPDDSPDGLVVLRSTKLRSRVPQEYRYSADILRTYKEEIESNPAFRGVGTRRLNSERIDERNELEELTTDQVLVVRDGAIEKAAVSKQNDSVFDQEVMLSDVDVRVPSDDNLSQSYEGTRHDQTSPLLQSPALKSSKKQKSTKSPLLRRRSPTIKERFSPKQQHKLMRGLTKGLTKDDVSPLIGKMRTILNFHEVSDEEETPAGEPSVPPQSPPAQSNEQHSTPATTPGTYTSLDRVPRSPAPSKNLPNSDFPPSPPSPPSTTSSAKHPISPLSYQHQTSLKSSPPPSPPSPTVNTHERRSTSPSSFPPDGEKGNIHKSASDKSFGRLPYSRIKKNKSMSLDGSATSMMEILSVQNMVVEPLHEENTEEEEEAGQKLAAAGKKEGKKGKLMRDGIFRRSKSRKKAMTIVVGGPDVEKAINESFTKGSGGTGAVRAKSSKQRPKLDSVFSEPSQPTDHVSGEKTEEVAVTSKENASSSRHTEETQKRGSAGNSLTSSPAKTNPHSSRTLSTLDELTQASPASTLTAPPLENTSDSDREEAAQHMVRSMSESYPELEIREDRNWVQTIDRRVLKKLNKHERDRQNIIHELIQTERHHHRILHVLKLVFKEHISKFVSEESLSIMFPELDTLIEISNSFLERLEERRGKEGTNIVIHDISDILLEEFTGSNRERILGAFGEFCSFHLIAIEMYKEQLKKKQFGRLVQQLYRLKECQRLYLPDYYTSVSQRLTKMVQFLARLVKKTDTLKLDHMEQLRLSQRELESLVTAVDQYVDDRKNQLELEEIQDKLEINFPRSKNSPLLHAMKDLNLTAQSRRLIKCGDALLIHGHGKQLPVHIVLVTDLVVLLTERDQKYNIPALLDLKPPIIRLYDLHVRVNASVRSGIQLLLLEKGIAPEMFRLDFQSKKEAKAWELRLTNAVDVCKEKGIKCEYFGSESVAVQEEKREEVESRRASLSRVKRSESQKSPTAVQSPTLRRIHSARATLETASRVLSMFVSSSNATTMDVSTSSRQPQASSGSGYRFGQSPKNRHNTIHQLSTKSGDGGSVTGDRDTSSLVTSTEIDGGSKKTQRSKLKRKGLDRSSTFKGRGEDKKERDRGGGSEAADSGAHQQLLACAHKMKDSLEEILNDYEKKDGEIERLKQELEQVRREAEAARQPNVVVARNSSPRNSPPQFRPHSCHVDITEMPGSLSQPAGMGGDMTGLAAATFARVPRQTADTGT